MNKERLWKKGIVTGLLLVTLAVASVYVVKQAQGDQTDSTKLQVVASYYPLYEFATHVGKDKVQVINATPAGIEPHEYEPSAKALADAAKARVFIYNGGHLEPWTDNFVKTYTGVAVKANNGISLLQTPDDEQEGSVQDPHFWLDPVFAQRIVDTIRDGFIQADPDNAGYYVQQARQYNAQLATLDNAYRNGLASCAMHRIVASHAAFSYVGQRYGFAVTPIAGLSPEAEPSAGQLAAISTLIREQGISYIFFEQLASRRLADTIARETGASTLVLDPIEGIRNADQKQGKDYLSIQRENLRNLRTALACQ